MSNGTSEGLATVASVLRPLRVSRVFRCRPAQVL